MASVMKEDKELAWAILTDLADRAGIPEWLGSKSDPAAREVADNIAGIIAAHREASS